MSNKDVSQDNGDEESLWYESPVGKKIAAAYLFLVTVICVLLWYSLLVWLIAVFGGMLRGAN